MSNEIQTNNPNPTVQTTNPNPTGQNELTLQIANLVRNSDNVTLRFKLDGNNYPLWARLMRVAIGSRGKSSHNTGQPPPPKETNPTYYQWEKTDCSYRTWKGD
ncbi:hypothetical protein C2S53_019819 [Perilla frutescens var. hirtella]|uniref:Retrotransposon Copia-like N-terminal domain-containing protein n=1 Tax=Perilla frutescens var. hirtella TaxID=608512 RepID=A0AAD4JJ08_PERFH|nr:hypothetical protein C2S53_019819 [Perilla frutescens var. hirtella]